MITSVPGISNLRAPQGAAVDQMWRPTAREMLKGGSSFSIDTDYRVGGLDSIGVNKADFPEGTEVVATIEDGIDKKEHPEDLGFNLALVKYPNPSGHVDFFIVTDTIDEQGETIKQWTSLPTGHELTIGRTTTEEAKNDPSFLDGVDLTGKEFSDGVSRKHLTIKNIYGGGVEISGFGQNGTKVEAVRAKQEVAEENNESRQQARAAGNVAVHSEATVDMVKVKMPQEVEIERLQDIVTTSNMALGEINSQVGDKDTMTKIWDYAVKSAHYREIGRREEMNPTRFGHRNIEGAYAIAMQAENKIPESARHFADDYRTHMINKVLSNAQLEELQASAA